MSLANPENELIFKTAECWVRNAREKGKHIRITAMMGEARDTEHNPVPHRPHWGLRNTASAMKYLDSEIAEPRAVLRLTEGQYY